jgi:general secretion pathway protein E
MSGLLSALVEHGVSDTDIEKATAYQSRYGGRIEQILVNMGSLGSDSLPSVYSKLLGLPVFSKDPRDWEPPESAVALPLEML